MRDTDTVAALPMYDWPECRPANDEFWSRIRAALVADGIPAPETLARCNADLPPVPGGIRDETGCVIAPDPAMLPPEEFDLHVLWRHPGLVFAQTCWGPMQAGLAAHVDVLWQPDYSGFKGGEGDCYRSAIIMRGDNAMDAPLENGPAIPLEMMKGRRLAYNDSLSMSGFLALKEDMVRIGAIANGDQFSAFWSGMVETGGHRESMIAVAIGRADVAAIDCRTWDMALAHEPLSRDLAVVGWTAPRPGLPFVRAKRFGVVR